MTPNNYHEGLDELAQKLWLEQPACGTGIVQNYTRALLDALAERGYVLVDAKKQEPVVIQEPNYHHEAMGCGLEDRGITDRYEAMQYGWDCAVERLLEQVPDEPLYTHPAITGRVALPDEWIELCRRLYIELFHCDRQMTHTLDEDGELLWTTGKTVSDVLADASAMLSAAPTPPTQPQRDGSLRRGTEYESCDKCKNNGNTRGICQNAACRYEPSDDAAMEASNG